VGSLFSPAIASGLILAGGNLHLVASDHDLREADIKRRLPS